MEKRVPMTYAYYLQVKRGVTPPAVPTFNRETQEKEKEGKGNMPKYECSVCGYVYDPAEGDPDNGIAPGTAFEDLPEDWVCPVCGAGREEFEQVS